MQDDLGQRSRDGRDGQRHVEVGGSTELSRMLLPSPIRMGSFIATNHYTGPDAAIGADVHIADHPADLAIHAVA